MRAIAAVTLALLPGSVYADFEDNQGLGPSTDLSENLVNHDDVTWAVRKGKTCKETCQILSKTCNARAIPDSPMRVIQVAKKVGLKCTSVSNVDGSPQIGALVDGAGACKYSSAAKFNCEAEAAATSTMFCPCGDSWPEFMLAGKGQTCGELCGHGDDGSKCNADLTPRKSGVLTTGLMEATMKTLGITCTPTEGAATKAAMLKNNACTISAADADLSCNFKPLATERLLCQCFDADDVDASPWLPEAQRCRDGSQYINGEGVGGSKTSVGTAMSEASCYDLVKDQCKTAQAATYVAASRACFCEEGISSVQDTVGARVCWFPDDPTLWEVLAMRASPTPVVFVAVACTALLALMGAAGRRRAPRLKDDEALLVE